MNANLDKGKAYKYRDGTKYMIFGTIDDIYNYVFIANLSSNTVVRMLPETALRFISKLKLEPIELDIKEK